jgi:SAM-dependent methyltransferase
MTSDDDDVPIRVDFRDAATARTWIEDTRLRRPYRPRFFAAFCTALSSRRELRILELGSGPGQLAREILVHCDVHTYVALDFSPAMLARGRNRESSARHCNGPRQPRTSARGSGTGCVRSPVGSSPRMG